MICGIFALIIADECSMCYYLTVGILESLGGFIKAWALLHEEELNADWKLAVNGEEIFRIDPLK